MKMTTTTVDNGVNVEALLGARQALTDAPEAAQFKWRATCSWVNGTHSRSTVRGFFGLGTEQSHKTEFKYDADHPGDLRLRRQRRDAGRVRAGGPGLLPDGRHCCGRTEPQDPAALGEGHARSRHGPARASSASTARCATASTASRWFTTSTPMPRSEEIAALVAQSQRRSAVFDIVTNPTNVAVEVRMSRRARGGARHRHR